MPYEEFWAGLCSAHGGRKARSIGPSTASSWASRLAATVPSSSWPTRPSTSSRTACANRPVGQEAPPSPPSSQSLEKPHWLESVRRNHRGAEPFARPRQVGTTQVSLPSLESNAGERAIGNCANVACLCVQRGMPASPHTVHGGCRRRRPCRSCYPCASSNKWDCRALRRDRNLLHRTAGYVTRSSGGVGEAGRLSPIPIGLPEGRVNENALHQSNM